MSQEQASYPVFIRGELSEPPGRGWWLIMWLLAIPHYIIVAFFQGGWGGGNYGLVAVLVIIAAVVLLFTGKYPKDIFNLVVGMNRWSYRVAGYAALMTDKYPPFRLGD